MSVPATVQSLIADRIAATPLDAELSPTDGGWTLTVRRVLAHRPVEVWPMLTDPEQLARWSPVVPDRPLTSVGPATSRENPDATPVDASVTVVDPPVELVHRWGDSTLRWTLAAVPDGTQLQLEHSFAEPAQASSYGAGWHVCLATLAVVDAGHEVTRVVGPLSLDYGWQDLHDRYAALLDTGGAR